MLCTFCNVLEQKWKSPQATTLYNSFLKLGSFTKFSMLYSHPHRSMPYSHWQLHAHISCSCSFLMFIVRKTLLTFHTHEPLPFTKLEWILNQLFGHFIFYLFTSCIDICKKFTRNEKLELLTPELVHYLLNAKTMSMWNKRWNYFLH
jgi:hypothetical protein